MDASCTKKRPSDTSVVNDQILDLFAEQSPVTIIFEKDYLELKSEVGYWKSMHAKAVKREQSLKDKIKVLQGQIRDLRQRVFSKQNEKTGTKKGEGKSTPSNPKRPRGQQPGSEGHGLTERPDLPESKESVGFTEEPVCPECGKPYIPDGTCESETIQQFFHEKAYVKSKFVHELFFSLHPTSLDRHTSIRTLLWGCHLPRCILISVGRSCYLGDAIFVCQRQPTVARIAAQSPE